LIAIDLRIVSELGIRRRMTSFWSCAQLEPKRERLALHCLHLAGFETYFPRVKAERRIVPLFLGYVFVRVYLQWHQIRWSPGVRRLVLDGDRPARVPDTVVAEIQSREHNGLVVLPKPRGLQRGDRLRVTAGAFAGQLGLYDGQRPHERVAVLLSFLGSQTPVELAKRDVAPA
jgi:transcriptional antiterminator RfaH